MNTRAALKGQYHAALAMLRQAIDECPENLWAGGAPPVPFWQVAYHTLFFTHLYLQPDGESFRPWTKARENYQFLDRLPWPPHDRPRIGEPYTRGEIIEYWQFCDALVDTAVDTLDLDSASSGFAWYKIPKLDHQITNIRHIQHHAAILAGRLRTAKDIDITWR